MSANPDELSGLDCRKALDEALFTGAITITKGTKGGRGRQVPASAEAISALRCAVEIQGTRSNLVFEDFTYKRFYKYVEKRCSKLLKENNIKCPQELRATYACRRYIELTGCFPPVVAGAVAASPADDKLARLVIARELGHNRPSITNSYVGRR